MVSYQAHLLEALRVAGGEVPWLVLTAMFLAQSFARTGLGKRIAYSFVSLFGAHPLGLAYSLVFRYVMICFPSFLSKSCYKGSKASMCIHYCAKSICPES